MLTSLLRFSLFGGDNPFAELRRPISDEEWLRLFDESRRQAVTALLYDAILMLPKEQRPPKGILFHFTSITQTIEQDNCRREKALHSFAHFVYGSIHKPMTVVKGSSLARLYPQPMHRECGDNDLYAGSDTREISRLVESASIAVDRKDPRHSSYKFDDASFECHSYLLYHDDDPEWHSVPFGDDGLMRLPAEEEAFFLAKHMEHHAVFFHNPVRMRSLVDWCLLLSQEDFDYERFRALKRGTDVDVYAELLTLYCNGIFGLNMGCDIPEGLAADDFRRIYMRCPERHRLALVRVARRSWKYLRYGRQYRKIYGQSMFRRFYFFNLRQAISQHL